VAAACAGLACTAGMATPGSPSPGDAGRPPVETRTDAAAPVAGPVVVVIDPPGRTFVGTQLVKLSAAGPRATIYYTIDGSLPTRASPVYTRPITIDSSVVLRATAEGQQPGPVSAAAFVQVAPELDGWSSNLPVVVLHTHESGPLPAIRDAPLQPGSMTLLQPRPDGRTLLVGAPTVSARAGLRHRGESSLVFPQKSYAFELRRADNDQDSDLPLLGFPADSDFALVGGGFIDRSLMRNALAYAISNQISRYAARTRFVEVFVCEGRATLEPDDYRGVFTFSENIKRSPARVNITRLAISDQRDPAVTGGYSFRIDWGAPHFTAGMINFQYVYPRWEEISQPGWNSQRAYLQGFLAEFLEAVAQPDLRHPRTGKMYSAYIDVPAFIDHNLLIALFKNIDGLRLSAYFHKDRGGPIVAGPVWDFDRSSGTLFDGNYLKVPRAAEPREWASGDGTHPLTWSFWARLFTDPAFKAAHKNRWGELTKGPFAVENIHRLIDRFAAELKEAQARHFARWPDMPPTGGGHQAEVNLLKDWFSVRVPWVTSQL
jgi:hypothetical protein